MEIGRYEIPVWLLRLVLAQFDLPFLLRGMQFEIAVLQSLHHDLDCYSLVVSHFLRATLRVPSSFELVGLQSFDLIPHE